MKCSSLFLPISKWRIRLTPPIGECEEEEEEAVKTGQH